MCLGRSLRPELRYTEAVNYAIALAQRNRRPKTVLRIQVDRLVLDIDLHGQVPGPNPASPGVVRIPLQPTQSRLPLHIT